MAVVQVEKQREQLRAELSKMSQLVGGNEKIIKQQVRHQPG